MFATFVNLANIDQLETGIHTDGDFLLFSDGIMLVWLGRLFGYNFQRTSFDFSSIAVDICKKCNLENKQMLFVGGSKIDVNYFRDNLQREFKNLKFDVIDGYEGLDSLNSFLSERKYDVIVLSLGSPLQNQIGFKLVRCYPLLDIWTAGGFITQASSSLYYYPSWITNFNLRWLYRFYKEPHVRYRVLFVYPKNLLFLLFNRKLRSSMLAKLEYSYLRFLSE